MAKMTVNGVQELAAAYVAAAKQAGAWNATTDNLYHLIDKIGLQIMLDGKFQDKLPELDGNDLPLGKTIEEYFIDLTLPTDFDPTGAGAMKPSFPDTEEASYSYTLGRKKIATSEPINNVERAALTAQDAGNMTAKILERLANSYSLYTYAQKKQLIANLIAKAKTAGLIQTLAAPSDTATGEAAIKQIKADVETAQFATENTSLSKTLIGAAPELILFVKKGVMPSIEVDTMAGAFNEAKLAIPCRVKVVDDFGNADAKVWGVLCDPRGIKLHRGYHAIRTNVNGDGDFINYFDHSENTGFISKFTFVKVYTNA